MASGAGIIGGGRDTGSSSYGTKSYHNGGIEGQGLGDWYYENLEADFEGSKWAGPGGSKGSGAGGSKGSGTGGGKGAGSGGRKGSGPGGSGGSGTGGSGGSGTGGSGGSGSGGGGGGVLCFCQGTRITTSNGFENVEDISPGSLILTFDGTYKALRLILRRQISRSELTMNSKLRPVRLSAGAMGHGLPLRDLLVSRQHKLMISSPIAKRMFGNRNALLPSIKLTEIPGVFIDSHAERTVYFHLVFDEHEVIWAEGLPSESFHTGAQALAALDDAAREELFAIFPDLATGNREQETACFVPDNRRQTKLVSRHVVNNKPFYNPVE